MKNKLVMGASAAAGVILVFLAVFAGIQKAQINALNSKIDNQTAIINRVIGAACRVKLKLNRFRGGNNA